MKTFYYILLLCFIDYLYVLNRYNLTIPITYTNKINNYTNKNWGAY